MYDFILILA